MKTPLQILVCLLSLAFLPATVLSQENTALLCADGIDNDNDGFIDCMDQDCDMLPNEGCMTCNDDGLSFADTVLSYFQTCPNNANINPLAALGVSDQSIFSVVDDYVSLGSDGELRLGFTNNLLVNSGDNLPDLFVFEVGSIIESTVIELRPFDQNTIDILIAEGITDLNADGYFDFGTIAGSTSSMDLDALVVGYNLSALKFDAIKISNIPGAVCEEHGDPGPDIDAVCALSSTPVDCNNVVGGQWEVDDCGVCLEVSDPLFNQSCADCNGTPNGNFVHDDCGECLEISDPTFNTSCLDCEGVLNGPARVDQCGLCLDTLSVNFNQSCVDCSGTPNGLAVIDDCGQCLPPSDPLFNQSCLEEVFIPTVFSPNDDGVNDRLEVFKKNEINATVKSYSIFDRWGGLLYQEENFEFTDTSKWWDGKSNNVEAGVGLYLYAIELELVDGSTEVFHGGVYLLR